MKERIMAVDVGGGTQDLLLYEDGQPVENCLQMVLPSRTVIVGSRIAAATTSGKAVFLHGTLMGGGACTSALKRHLRAGLKAYATPAAAKTIHDDLQRVREMGVQIIDGDPPRGAVGVEMNDLDVANIEGVLERFHVQPPEQWAVAVQDHGEKPGISNREFRFHHWRKFLREDGDVRNLLYEQIPDYLTRMKAVRQSVPSAYLADTGAAAIWGALGDPVVREHQDEGLIILNVGNQHTVGVLLQGLRMLGLFEHHTGLMDPKKIKDYVNRLRAGTLTHEEVFRDRGHGCYLPANFTVGKGFQFVAVTGPQRQRTSEAGYYWAVPYGNMMQAGCYGLITALKARRGEQLALD